MQENTMKPKRIQRHTGARWQGKGVSTGDKATLSQATPTCVSSLTQVKPFTGKVFYLDLPSNRVAETLESDIKDLGGTVEKFFSKEIKYLVSNKREARYVRSIRQDSPVPSPDSGPSSPHPQSNQHRPGSCRDNIKKSPDTFVPSRGKSLVERVVKEQERVKMNKILSNALEWGVKILYIDDIMAYMQKKKNFVSSQCPVGKTSTTLQVKAESVQKQSVQKYKAGRISKPFVKVEDSSRHYRPLYLTLSNMPEFNLKTVPPCSPFCVEDKVTPGNKQSGRRGAKASASEERAHGRKKNRDKKRGGYCECCMIKYENVTAHLKSERHRTFSKSDEYLVVDKLVSTMHCNLVHIKTQVKRPKCSVSSVLIAAGPCRKTAHRRMEDLFTTDVIKEEDEEEQHQTSKITSVTGSAPGILSEGKMRSCYSHSDRSKHKSLACKLPCRQNSLTSCSHKAEQAQTPQPTLETVPSRGECPSFIPSRVTPDIKVERKKTQTSSSSQLLSEASSKCLDVRKNQQVESSVCETVQDRNMPPDQKTGNVLSEGEEADVTSQSFSPVRKIRRKVRVYRRKRRKVDACVDSAKPSDIPNNSIQRLWELFQSTDDMDVEFLGFED